MDTLNFRKSSISFEMPLSNLKFSHLRLNVRKLGSGIFCRRSSSYPLVPQANFNCRARSMVSFDQFCTVLRLLNRALIWSSFNIIFKAFLYLFWFIICFIRRAISFSAFDCLCILKKRLVWASRAFFNFSFSLSCCLWEKK